MSEDILVVCAHSDDQIFGPGGTLAKYANEGKNIHTYIMSYGELSLPHIRPEVVIKRRVREAKIVDKVINGKGVIFFGLKEGRFKEEFKKRNFYDKLGNIILKHKPSKIFTHSAADPLPDHKDTNELVLKVLDKIKYKCEVYTFDVWNIFNIKNIRHPKMYVNISDTFKIKTKALNCFKSQKISMISLMWTVYLKAVLYGIRNGCLFAERFYRVR